MGSPGTGKTAVANYYSHILAELGLLSNGEGTPISFLTDQVLTLLQVVVKNPADLIGNVIGQSETNTKTILAATVGKVLIIDEVGLYCIVCLCQGNLTKFQAYRLYSGSDKGGTRVFSRLPFSILLSPRSRAFLAMVSATFYWSPVTH